LERPYFFQEKIKSMKIKLIDFGEVLSSRPEGRDAALSFFAYGIEKNNIPERILIEFKGVQLLTPSWLSEFVQTLKAKGIKVIDFEKSTNSSVKYSVEAIADEIGSD